MNKIFFLAFDMAEAVQCAKAQGIHYSRVAYVRDLNHTKVFRGQTMALCPKFHDRFDAREITEALRFRGCQIIEVSKIDGSVV